MRSLVVVALVCVTGAGMAQRKAKDDRSGYDRAARATLIHDAIVYVSGDEGSQKLSEVEAGHEVVVMDRSGAWVKVFANTDTPDQRDDQPEFAEAAERAPESGWIKDKGVITPATPGGDAILFGAAETEEDEAEEPHAPKGAATAAHLLYRRVFEYFPNSPYAAEAAFRSADIRWQLDKRDISTLPSAKEQEAYLRPTIYEGDMKKVIRGWPNSTQAALAAYDLIDNKLCGDWQGLPKCPEMETQLYLRYADQYRDSPKAAEAMYKAVYREGVLVNMYTLDDEKKRADAVAKQVQGLAEEMKARFPKSDYTPRALSVAYRVAQGIPIYGNDKD